MMTTQRENIQNRALELMRLFYNSDREFMKALIETLMNHISHGQFFMLEQELQRLKHEYDNPNEL